MYLCNIEDYVEFYIIMRMDKFLKYLIYNLFSCILSIYLVD